MGLVLYCLECDCAQRDGKTCWQCGGSNLTAIKPSRWPLQFPGPTTGSQTVIFEKGKR